ncbi:MAG: tyrosine-type recombinase/integrase, partial [Planctomycetota bacterium]
MKQRKKSQQAVRYVEVTEYQALLNATCKLWWKTLISIACGSGLRRDEIFNLTWQNIDFENKLICINARQSTKLTLEWEPKDHQNRIVPISEHTIQLLAELQLTAPEGYPYIFIMPRRFKVIKNREKYTPTHCQDKKLVVLRWTHRPWLRPLERREPEGRPECQR